MMRYTLLPMVAAVLVACAPTAEKGFDMPTPPVAEKRPKHITQLGFERVDDYAWLKADNWQEVMRNPQALPTDIRDHLEAENAYTQAVLAETEDLQDTLFAEMKGRIKDDDSSAPEPDGPWQYYSRYAAGAQHPIFARKPRKGGEEQILLDTDALAEGHDYFDLGDLEHSADHKLFGYAVDTQGSEYYSITVLDLETGKAVGPVIEGSTGDFIISPDTQYLFWIWRDENGRPAKIYRRPIGGDQDTLVYEDENPGFFLSVDVSESEDYIFLSAGDHTTSETWWIPASDPTAAPQRFAKREDGVRYSVTHLDDAFYVLTNADGAVDFKIAKTSLDQTERAYWQDWLPHRPGHFVTGLLANYDHLIRQERVKALDQILITHMPSNETHAISFAEEAYALDLSSGLEFESDQIRFVYQSPTTPRQWFDYDLKTRDRTQVKEQIIPSGHNPADYVAKRVMAKGHDGVEIPITLLMHKDTPTDGSAPVLLYGYGSYGMSMDATFSIRALSLVNRGVIWATAHIRGGADLGYQWYLDGKKDKKTNTFKDFISSAEALIEQDYTQAGRIVAYGGSAGGMLMGAVANMRPDLWAGIIAAVPFVDVLNTMSDDTLPLTPPEWPEWGNPITNKADYELIASYSPYDQVSAQAYPPVLATGGLSDPRVTYWEPAKWTAKLRDHTTSDNPILLKINMEAGHGGASGRYDFLKDIALDYAFALWALKQP